MRTNGVTATDIVVLVVAIDDGLKPQTVEAILQAKKSGCPILIALNKIDKITGERERETARRKILNQLLEYDLMAEEYGGDVQVVEVSALSGEGLDSLKESLLLQAEMMDLQASYTGYVEATVLEGSVQKGRGVVVDMLIKWGELKTGDIVVAGTTYGRVKSITDDKGKIIKKAYPSCPVRITGLRSMPSSGSELISVESEALAKQITSRRERLEIIKNIISSSNNTTNTNNSSVNQPPDNEEEKEKYITPRGRRFKKPTVPYSPLVTGRKVNTIMARAALTLQANELAANQPQDLSLSLILKSETSGSLNALITLIEDLNNSCKDINIHIIHSSIGDITKSDIEMASSAEREGERERENAVILGFNVGIADGSTRQLSKLKDVQIIKDSVIYRLEDAVKGLMESSLPKIRTLQSEGVATVLKVFHLNAKSPLSVAGVEVQSGSLKSGPNIVYSVIRKGAAICTEREIIALKRFKDNVNEVSAGNECGLSLSLFNEFEEGDEIYCYTVEYREKELVIDERERERERERYK